MSASERRGTVVEFAERPEPGPLRKVVDTLRALLGKMVSLTDVCLLAEATPYVVTNAAAGAGTALAFSRVFLDFSDAGVDQVRVVVRGDATAAGPVQVTVYDLTNSKELARVAMAGAGAATVAGAWTTIIPTGLDQQVEIRVIGDGALDPELSRVSLQLRTLRAQP
jgi:hypothetical protein